MTRVCIIQGHPTAGGGHFCHALAEAYSESAIAAGHEVEILLVAEMACASASAFDPATARSAPTRALLLTQDALH